jgi:hypothetical protein|tara:strand:+ start:630 stop:1550 length:921 start_codon:yes stop_codon:yes gene_type:complete
MLNFKNFSVMPDAIREEYIEEQYDVLIEKLITFGGKAYPKFGNVVIMAGGAGSGKGFIKDKLIGIEGKVFDVDVLKSFAAKGPMINKRVKKETGIDLKKTGDNLKDPENVSKMHEIISDFLNLPDKRQGKFFASVLGASPDRKPNIIFDVTLKDLRKLEKITRQVSSIGYDKQNIHIVWVVNDIEVAKAQNTKRDRVVPTDILVNTHRGASNTMNDIINMGNGLKKYMDGDIVFAFNKINIDSEIIKSDKSGSKVGMKGDTKGGMYLKDANYFYAKRKGKGATPASKLTKELRAKIAQYVPKGVEW